MTTTDNTDIPNTTKPGLLKILCILTFIGAGLSGISNFIMFLTVDMIREAYENGIFDFLDDETMLDAMELMLSANSIFFIFQALLLALSVYGAYLMWNLKKIGFHFYTIAQIVLLIVPQILLSGLPFPTFELIISLIFVTLYAKNLQYMS